MARIDVEGSTISGVSPQSGFETTDRHRSIIDFPCGVFGDAGTVWDAGGDLLIPAMVDMHIHSRDPGFPEKETWETLTAAAYSGGVVAVADMPNTKPATMTSADARSKIERASKAGIEAKVYLGVGSANVAQLSQYLSERDTGICGVKIYYGQSTGSLMFDDLETLERSLPRDRPLLLSFHSEDQCRIEKNYHNLTDADLARTDHSAFRLHSAVRDAEAARLSTMTILEWAMRHRRAVHIAHLSAPAEVELIRSYKERGVSVTSEVAPHHLLLCEDDYEQLGAFLKVNPPVRSRSEAELLKKYLQNGEIDAVATDHAPHTAIEKRTSLKLAPSGLPSIEFFVPLLFKLGRMLGLSPSRLVDLGSRAPARLLGLDHLGRIAPGYEASFVQVREGNWTATESHIRSKCGWSPYLGFEFPVWVEGTWHRGRRSYARQQNLMTVC